MVALPELFSGGMRKEAKLTMCSSQDYIKLLNVTCSFILEGCNRVVEVIEIQTHTPSINLRMLLMLIGILFLLFFLFLD